MYLDCTSLTYYRIHNYQITGINNRVNHFLEGYISTFELEKAIADKEIKNDLRKTRFRMLVLSLSRGHRASLKQLLRGFVFYFKHLTFNIRDFKVLVYSMFVITCNIAFRRSAYSIISRVTIWMNSFGFI